MNLPLYDPEMFGASRRGTEVDIYSLGCLNIELFGEQRVRSGLSNGIEIMQKMCGSFGTPPMMPKTDHLPLQYKNM